MVRGQQVLLIVEDLTQALNLASRNMPDLMLTTPDRLVLSEILKADKIIIEPGALMYIQVEIAIDCCSNNPLSLLASTDLDKSSLVACITHVSMTAELQQCTILTMCMNMCSGCFSQFHVSLGACLGLLADSKLQSPLQH